MKQTAVEFLHSEYKKILGDTLVDIQKMFAISDSYEKAKEKEKQQIIEAIIETSTFGESLAHVVANEHYDKTFKKIGL